MKSRHIWFCLAAALPLTLVISPADMSAGVDPPYRVESHLSVEEVLETDRTAIGDQVVNTSDRHLRIRATPEARSLHGPEGAMIRIIVPDPLDPQTIYLGTFTGAIQKSTDGGSSWSTSSRGLSQIDYRALAVHPTQPNILLAAGFGGGPWRSEDGGQTWSASGTGADIGTGIEFVLDSVDPSRVYYLSSGRTYASTDTGNTWNEIPIPGASGRNAMAIDPLDNTRFLVGANNGLYHSTDSGGSWTPVTDDFSAVSNLSVREVVFDVQNPSLVYLAFWTHYTDENGGVYRSTDGGLTWSSANSGIPAYANFDYHSMAVDPFNEGHAYVAAFSQGIYKTTDSGLTWNSSSSGIPGGQRQCWAVATSLTPDAVYCGSAVPEGGFYLSTNASGDWSRSVEGLYAEDISALEADRHTSMRFCVGIRGGIFRWNGDAGPIGLGRDASWERICPDLPSTGTADRVYRNVTLFPSGLYTSHILRNHSGVFVSMDDGASCQERTNDDHWTRAIGVNPLDPYDVYTGTSDDGVFESTDAGLTWDARNTGFSSLACSKLIAAHDNPLRIYAGMGDGIYRSIDGGITWTVLDNGIPSGVGAVDIDIDPVDSMRLFAVVGAAVGSPCVYRSTDGGDSWVPLDIPGIGTALFEFISKIDISATDPDFIVGLDAYDHIIVGDPTTPHVVYSEDGGDSWTLLADDRPYVNMAVMPTDPPTIIVGAVGEGVLQIYGPPLDPSGVEDGLRDLQSRSAALLRVLPNPSSLITVIQYQLPRPAEASLALFDVTGRLVRQLIDTGPHEAGIHQVTWDGTDDRGHVIGSAVYICRLKTSYGDVTHRISRLR